MCLLIVAGDLGRCLRTSSVVRPGHVTKWLFLMASHHVSMVGAPAHWCRYVTSSLLVVECHALCARMLVVELALLLLA